jgi:hypothetical protein
MSVKRRVATYFAIRSVIEIFFADTFNRSGAAQPRRSLPSVPRRRFRKLFRFSRSLRGCQSTLVPQGRRKQEVGRGKEKSRGSSPRLFLCVD